MVQKTRLGGEFTLVWYYNDLNCLGLLKLSLIMTSLHLRIVFITFIYYVCAHVCTGHGMHVEVP